VLSARPVTDVGAAHGGSGERHAATTLESTSTIGLIHVYKLRKRPKKQRLIMIFVVPVQTNKLE